MLFQASGDWPVADDVSAVLCWEGLDGIGAPSCEPCASCRSSARRSENQPPPASAAAPVWRARPSWVCAATVLVTIALAAADATSCTVLCPLNAVAKPGPLAEMPVSRFICARARRVRRVIHKARSAAQANSAASKAEFYRLKRRNSAQD